MARPGTAPPPGSTCCRGPSSWTASGSMRPGIRATTPRPRTAGGAIRRARQRRRPLPNRHRTSVSRAPSPAISGSPPLKEPA
ncbi:hypothetical protein DF052_14825 [Burkholderia glumae]|nr:hypothetical protein DF052_14825 [Burkholderia glumae]